MNDKQVPSRTPTKRGLFSIIAAIALLAATSGKAVAQEDAIGRTPPRLSYLDGEASFWRPGADDWSAAQVNLPLAPGDQLYTGERSNLELQIGSRAYLRAAENTQFGLENQEPDFLQLRVAGGQVALDLRNLTPGHTVELDTPHAAVTIERPGYYRAVVAEHATTFVVRRGGSALITPAGGDSAVIGSNEQAVIRGTGNPALETFAAGALDDWDGWNYGRTDQLYASASSRYVPDDVYGTHELDNYGTWRDVPTYGSVWVPRAVPTGWAPYTTGRWIYDPFYGWTWLASEPWGWAPFHYGRWVYYDDYWAWAPGPRLRASVYAPALVAFFGGGGFGVGVSVGFPIAPVGWVSLSWGEPIYPWWGPVGFCDRPYWGGWGGSRVVINQTKIVNKTKIINVDGYRNSRHRDGLVVVKGDRFGRGDVRNARLDRYDRQNLRAIRSDEGVRPTRESLRPRDANGRRPPRDVADRPVVATRSPRDNSARLRAAGLTPNASSESRVRLVDSPRRSRLAATSTSEAGRPGTVDRRRSDDVDDRRSRASVPNPRTEKQVQSPPNRQRRQDRSPDSAAPPASRSRTESQQPGVDRRERQGPPDRPPRGATLPRTSSPRSSQEGAPAAPAKQPRVERGPQRDSRPVAPPVPAQRSRIDRQPERATRQAAPAAPAQRSRNERAQERDARDAAPQPRSQQRYEQRQPRPEMPASRPQTQAPPQRDPRRSAPAVQSRRESAPSKSFSAVPQRQPQQQRVERSQPRPQQQQRVEKTQPQGSRPQREMSRSRPQGERPARDGGGSESRQSRRSSNKDRDTN